MAAGLSGALAMMVFENVYLAIHDDHLLLDENGRDTKIAWDEHAAHGLRHDGS